MNNIATYEIPRKSNQVEKNEYFHIDFPLVVNSYILNTTKKPIFLTGELNIGKKTMARQLGKIIGVEPIVFNFSHSTINGESYFDQLSLFEYLKSSEETGAYIIIEDIEKIDTYDSFLLMSYFLRIKDNKNPKSTIVILENNARENYYSLTSVVKKNSAVVTIGKDKVIEQKIIKEKEEREAKQKKMKGVK